MSDSAAFKAVLKDFQKDVERMLDVFEFYERRLKTCPKYDAGCQPSASGPGSPPRGCWRSRGHDGPCKDQYGVIRPDAEHPLPSLTDLLNAARKPS